jgi:hypothetical protein
MENEDAVGITDNPSEHYTSESVALSIREVESVPDNPRPTTTDVFVPPPLPQDKSYHAMICYESEDKKWAQKIYKQLVSEPFNFQCCIADIHFMPSVPIIENIEVRCLCIIAMFTFSAYNNDLSP